jgi:hypothetical protein
LLPRRRFTGDEGALGATRRWEGHRKIRGGMADTVVGMTPTRGHRRVAVCGEVTWRRRGLAPTSNHADDRAVNGKLRAWGSFSPREETLKRLSNAGDAGMP